MIAPGTVLADKFRVERILGQGGMGVVVEATHLTLGQRVAIKLLLPEYLGVHSVVERFVREARAVAKLRGEHVCRVSDVGTLPGGAPYIVMEMLHGSDLATVRAVTGKFELVTAVDFVLQASLGVAEAHAAGLVHRDLKPSNLFVTRRPDGTQLVKVLDFGIAKSQDESPHSLTTTAAVMGSPSYMSPEQMRSSRNVDQRTDIWALGVVLFELIAGRLPFVAPTVTELAILIATEKTPALGVDVPPAFEAIVRKCLSKNPDDRFSAVTELANALVPFGGPAAKQMAAGIAHIRSKTEPVAPTRPIRPPESTTLASAASSMSTEGALVASGARRRSKLGFIGLGLALATGGTIAAVMLRGSSTSTGSASGSAGSSSGSPVVVVPPDAAPLAPDVAPVVEKTVALDAAVPDAPLDAPKKKYPKLPKNPPPPPPSFEGNQH